MIRIAAVVAAFVGAVLVSAPTAAATPEEYLQELADRYTSLTPQQLLEAGNKVCAAESSGSLSPDLTAMVERDYNVSISTALEIVSAAEWNIC
jgi:hypothetical protein